MFFKQEVAGDVVQPIVDSEPVVENGVIDDTLLESNCDQVDTPGAQEKTTTSEQNGVAQDQLVDQDGTSTECVVPSEIELVAVQRRKETSRHDGVVDDDEIGEKAASEDAEEVTELEEGEIGDDSDESPKEEVPREMRMSEEKVDSGENGIAEWSGRNSPAGRDTLHGDVSSMAASEESLSNSNQSCTSAPASGGRAGSDSNLTSAPSSSQTRTLPSDPSSRLFKLSDGPSTSTGLGLKSSSSPDTARREGRSDDMKSRLERKKKSRRRRHGRRVEGLDVVEGLVDSEVYRPPQPEEATDSQRQVSCGGETGGAMVVSVGGYVKYVR